MAFNRESRALFLIFLLFSNTLLLSGRSRPLRYSYDERTGKTIVDLFSIARPPSDDPSLDTTAVTVSIPNDTGKCVRIDFVGYAGGGNNGDCTMSSGVKCTNNSLRSHKSNAIGFAGCISASAAGGQAIIDTSSLYSALNLYSTTCSGATCCAPVTGGPRDDALTCIQIWDGYRNDTTMSDQGTLSCSGSTCTPDQGGGINVNIESSLKTCTDYTDCTTSSAYPRVRSSNPQDNQTISFENFSGSLEFNVNMDNDTISTSGTAACTGSVQISLNSFGSCFPITSLTPQDNDNRSYNLSSTNSLVPNSQYQLKVTTAAQDNTSTAIVAEHLEYFYTKAQLRLFYTNTTYDGNLGGRSGADSKCNSDANKPGGLSNVRAVINVSEDDLMLNMQDNYSIPEGIIKRLGSSTTIASNVDTFLRHLETTEAGFTVGAPTGFWSGIETSEDVIVVPATDNCSNWTSNSSGENGASGTLTTMSSNSKWKATDNTSCDTSLRILCLGW